jgi:hypothetical protein
MAEAVFGRPLPKKAIAPSILPIEPTRGRPPERDPEKRAAIFRKIMLNQEI